MLRDARGTNGSTQLDGNIPTVWFLHGYEVVQSNRARFGDGEMVAPC